MPGTMYILSHPIFSTFCVKIMVLHCSHLNKEISPERLRNIPNDAQLVKEELGFEISWDLTFRSHE